METLEDRLTPGAVEPVNLADPSFFGGSGSNTSIIATPDNPLPQVSDDGQLVLFQGTSPNLVPDDFNGSTDVFVYDRGTGKVNLVTGNFRGTGTSQRGGFDARMTPDGRYVVFRSDSNDLTPTPIGNFFLGQHRV